MQQSEFSFNVPEFEQNGKVCMSASISLPV